ncbi:MAG: ROK family protein [Actinobacteria bacterium]|jgi:predicted NBD/HSP70 family sugar kinase|nr:ROK family protein [Actinomycetota bacterium]
MATRSAATQDDLRRHNLARLLRRLHEGGAASRSDLVAFTGLNRSTVGVLVSELADVGLVYEGAGAAGQVGRPSLMVQPSASSAVVVAFDLRVERTVAALVGLGGDVLVHKEQRHKRSSYTPETALRNIVSLVGSMMGKAPSPATWVGVGIGVPGIVDHVDGRVRLAPNLGWVDVPLGDMVREGLTSAFGFAPAVAVNNDADLGAIAEHARGVGKHSRNLIYVSGEVGIGGGVIIDGRPMTGAGGYGGEVGHMVVNPQGAMCRCGAKGCWETEIGRDAILAAAGLGGDQMEVADVIAAASGGNPKAQAAIDEAGEWLGIGLANLVNLFNPEVIVLGGHLRLLFPLVSGTVYRRIHYALPAVREQVRVEVPSLSGDSTLLGAAETAFEALLSDPIDVLARAHHAAAS